MLLLTEPEAMASCMHQMQLIAVLGLYSM